MAIFERPSVPARRRLRVLPFVVVAQGALIAVLLGRPMFDRAATSAGPDSASPAAASVTPGESRPASAPAFEAGAASAAAAASRLATLVRSPRAEGAILSAANDPVGTIVYGRVVDEAGVNVPYPEVAFEDANGTSRSSEPAEDWQVAYGLHPGTWSVRVTATGFRPFKADIVLCDAASRFRYDVVLTRSTIVFVKFETPDGQDFDAARDDRVDTRSGLIVTAVATALPPASNTLGRAPCLAWLTWTPYGLNRSGIDPPQGCAGILDVGQPPPFSVSAVFHDSILATREVQAPLEVVVFKIAVETIESKLAGATVRVVDSDSGLPIEGASVAMDLFQDGKPEGSAADGRVTLRKRLPGLVCLGIEVDGYEPYHRWLFLGPGENRDLGEVRLDPVTALKGRLLGPDGSPVRGTISCFRLDRESLFPPSRSYWETRADGGFDLGPHGRGRYLVQGEDGKNAITCVVVDTSDGDVLDAVVRLARGAPVTFDLDLGGGERVIEVRDSAGHVLQIDGTIASGPTRLRAILAPGADTLTIRNGAEVTHTRQIMIGASPLRVRASG